MTTYTLDDRLQENRAAITEYWQNLTLQHLGIMLGVVALFVAVLGYLNQHVNVWSNIGWLTNIFGDFYANVSSELISIVITVLVLDRLNARRAREQYKQDLIRETGSIANNIAIDAVEQLRKAGWLTGDDSVLKGAELRGANLEKARLKEANLQHAQLKEANLQYSNLLYSNLQHAQLIYTNLQHTSLIEANLQHANLVRANLQHTSLIEANLQHANLEEANLQHTHLGSANLQDANLYHANLQQANLQNANLQNANLQNANLQNANLIIANLRQVNLQKANLRGAKFRYGPFDDKTILPDGVNWKPYTDMTRYTNPDHPDFWEPDWVKRQREEGKND